MPPDIHALPSNEIADRRPIGFFVHHQGRGHAKRCEAIIRHLPDRPITIFTADPSIISLKQDNVSVVRLPEMIAQPSRTQALHEQVAPRIMHCAPLGVRAQTEHMGIMAKWMMEADPALMFIDVSAEIAMLCRILSIPAVKVRMHGDRNDAGHLGAYDCCVAMFAPYAEALEQPDYPRECHRRTFYSGGLCTTTDAVPAKKEARRTLGLAEDREIVLVLSGGGGAGAPLAPLTMAARARRDALWLTVGPVSREGHETEFHNLQECGWVQRPLDYIAAADIVIASAGDNTVHEIARVGRPFLCIPEWRYFDEQRIKAEQIERLGAGAAAMVWPGSTDQWLAALEKAHRTDIEAQKKLFSADAAERSAEWLNRLIHRLWQGDDQLHDDETVLNGIAAQ